MSNDSTQDDYEVGYRKPPKNTQFQKGVSGNPKGRPKKAADFLSIFMKESESLIPINENGRRDLISKQEAVIKQLTNKAMTGNIPATRIYFDLYQKALEKAELSAAQQAIDSERSSDVTYLSDEDRRWWSGKSEIRKWKGTRIEYGLNQPLCSEASRFASYAEAGGMIARNCFR